MLPGTGEARRGDACATLAGTAAAVAYLDPPYAGTAGYAGNYALIDALLGAAPPPDAAPDLDALLDAGRAIPTVVLSYGGPTTTLDALAALVGRHRRVVRALAVPYPHLRSLARKESARASQEYLIVACR